MRRNNLLKKRHFIFLCLFFLIYISCISTPRVNQDNEDQNEKLRIEQQSKEEQTIYKDNSIKRSEAEEFAKLDIEQPDLIKFTTNQSAPIRAQSLEEAVYQSFLILSKEIPRNSVIAVINISSQNLAEGEFAVEELIMFFVNSKIYTVVDRQNLDIIKEEQAFQLSGDVDDDTAVLIGHLLGTSIVITGSIGNSESFSSSSGNQLRLRALNVETGQIIAISSWRY